MSKLNDIADHYGIEAQLSQLMEECAELIQASNKYKRLNDNSTQEELESAYNNLIEELADVELMSKQIIYLIGVDYSVYSQIKEGKIRRQLDRIGKEKNKNKEKEPWTN